MGGESWKQAWIAVLDELEADVAETEALLTDDHRMRDHQITKSWCPPQGLGPLPLDLKPRADAILARQIAVAQAVMLALTTNRRQAAMTRRIESGGRSPARPAYLDCAM